MQFANNNSLRNIYVLGLSLFLGISIPQYFITTTTADGVGPVRTDGIWVSHVDKILKFSPSLLMMVLFIWSNHISFYWVQFDDWLNTIFSSSPTVAIIVGTLLDNTLDANYVDDRGLAWWKPFQKRNGDVRNEEFYSLPLRIREYIPTRFLWVVNSEHS